MRKKVAEITRKRFIKAGSAALGALALGSFPFSFLTTGCRIEKNEGGIPVRTLGKTGEKVSILCLGGHHVGRINNENEAISLIRYAIDNGVTFLDNAWEYHKGRSEKLAGKALADGYRGKVFLMTKVHGRDGASAKEQLEQSLRRLDVDTIDLCQVHEVIYKDDPDRIFSPGGMLEVLEKAREEGKIRFIGFTGHKDPDIHLQMLNRGYSWDTVQMPVNAFDPHYRSFIKNVLPVLIEQKIGAIGMKSMGDPWLLKSGALTAKEALLYALSQPVSSIVSGMESMKMLKENIKVAQNYNGLNAREQEKILKKTLEYAANGKWEKYKTAHNFDGWYGRKIHGGNPPGGTS